MTKRWRIEPLLREHKLAPFNCGEPSLDDFLKRYARQNAKKDISRTYVAVPPGQLTVLGYYTISGASVVFDYLPAPLKRGIPKYPIPTTHIGRLAVDRPSQGQGLGEVLLFDALALSARCAEDLGIHAVTVDAINEQAREFYLQYGFIPLVDDPLHLFLQIRVVRSLLP